MMRYCPDCGGRLQTETGPTGIPYRVCSDCYVGTEVIRGP